ncbi:hypothetical protein GGR54DRAFT_620585 [Hypoxylon sp. NC1633]|nr:hypothetical protein GGR54DRAFT_620585 [Hypoxylon sp. NC1633]
MVIAVSPTLVLRAAWSSLRIPIWDSSVRAIDHRTLYMMFADGVGWAPSNLASWSTLMIRNPIMLTSVFPTIPGARVASALLCLEPAAVDRAFLRTTCQHIGISSSVMGLDWTALKCFPALDI